MIEHFQRTIRGSVIENGIDDHPHSSSVTLIDQLFQVTARAVGRLQGVEVSRQIAPIVIQTHRFCIHRTSAATKSRHPTLNRHQFNGVDS